MNTSYRHHFARDLDAAGYDNEQYSADSYSTLLWELEKAALIQLVEKFQEQHPYINYLDFATGTGRVASFMESLVNKATAIEISESMAARAIQRLQKTTVICGDITSKDSYIEDHYDLITAFRFFLNAEPKLQVAAIKALAARLKDDTSWLVFNNHGNLWSLKLAGWPIHRLRNLGQGWKPYGNYMRHSEVKLLLAESGMKILDVMGLGLLGGKISSRLSFNNSLRFETRLAAIPVLHRFGQDQLYVTVRDLQSGLW